MGCASPSTDSHHGPYFHWTVVSPACPNLPSSVLRDIGSASAGVAPQPVQPAQKTYRGRRALLCAGWCQRWLVRRFAGPFAGATAGAV